MDMSDFERTFSAYQRTDNHQTSPQDSTLRRRSKIQHALGETHRQKELSLIDGRRAQNLNILLSRYKLSEEGIREVVLSMDEGGKLDKDMVEQLLKYVPTQGERDMLQGHIQEKATFARADRFMLETSRYCAVHGNGTILYMGMEPSCTWEWNSIVHGNGTVLEMEPFCTWE
jgi:dishevelled associated activator of morphogenesis